MSSKTLATYRLPISSATKIGSLRIVTDRNKVHYADGSKIVSTVEQGVHTIITLADGRMFYVLTKEYQRL
jgi:hypothetical protein